MNVRQRVRKGLTLFHMWSGLILGLYFVMLGLTGSFLVFRADIEERITPELIKAPAPAGARLLPASEIVRGVRERFPDASEATVNTILFPRQPGGAFVLENVDGKTVHVSPYTGEVIRTIDKATNPIEFVANLHTMLLWEAKGMLMNTYGGLLIALLLLSGLWLWWPATVRQIRTRLSVKRGASLKRRFNDLHNVFGMAGLLFLLMSSVTGSAFGIWGTIHDGFYRILGQTKPAAVPTTVPVPPDAKRRSLDVLVADIERAMPGAAIGGVFYPATPDAPMTAYGAVDEGLSVWVSLAIDPYTGEILQIEDGRTVPTAGRVMQAINFLHLGQWGGWIVKTIYALFGLLPLGLFVTGVGRWWLRKKAQKPVEARSPATLATERV